MKKQYGNTHTLHIIFNQNGANTKVNGHNNGNEVDFLSLLEKEEADFAEQIKKQKTFLQGVFRDKEELAQMCVTQANKIAKLEHDKSEWQRKFVHAVDGLWASEQANISR